jgi:hypothetical protein
VSSVEAGVSSVEVGVSSVEEGVSSVEGGVIIMEGGVAGVCVRRSERPASSKWTPPWARFAGTRRGSEVNTTHDGVSTGLSSLRTAASG